MQSRKKYKRPNRQRKFDTPSTFNLKLFVALGLLLVILLMKKYDLAIGDFNVDSLYKVVYYNEDLTAIKKRLSLLNDQSNDTNDTLQNLPSDNTFDNTVNNGVPESDSEAMIINQEDLITIEDSDASLEDGSVDNPTTDVIVNTESTDEKANLTEESSED